MNLKQLLPARVVQINAPLILSVSLTYETFTRTRKSFVGSGSWCKLANSRRLLEDFETAWGISPKRFVESYEKAQSWDKCAEMNDILKKEGFKFPLKEVRKAIQRMQQNHKHIFTTLSQNTEPSPKSLAG